MDNTDKRDNLRFATGVGPDSSEELTYEVQRAATVEGVDVRIYRGAELDLQVRPFARFGGQDAPKTPLITFIGKEYVDGDGDFFTFTLSESVTPGDVIGVEVTNTSTEYSYDFSVDVDLEHEGGATRSATSLLGRVFG